MIKRLVRSLSSFSIGIFLYVLTNPFQWQIEILGIIGGSIFIGSFMLAFGLSKWELRDNKKIDTLQINLVQPAEQELIPIYLGLFVILLELSDLNNLIQGILVFLLFLIWLIYLDRSYYFNLLWLGMYRCYKVTDKNGNVYFLYSKRRDFKLYKDDTMQEKPFRVIRISNFTFIENN